MNRSAAVSGLVVVFSLAFVGCSAANSSGGASAESSGDDGDDGGGGGDSTSGAPGDRSSSGAGGGSSSGGSSGSGSGGGSGASHADGGGGTTATVDGGAVMPSHGCGQGTSCTPADDLAPPASADGFQVVLKSGAVTIQPSSEAYYCYYKTIPGNAAIDVGAFQSWMSKGASHHFITYQATTASAADGTLQQCPGVAGKWVYATSVSGQIIELKMPDGVGLNMSAGTQLILNMHFANTSSKPLSPVVKLNVLYAKNVQYQAGTMVSFNAGIRVPAAGPTGPGTQTVSGRCTAPVGSKFFAITSHTHKHATVTDVNFVNGGQTQNVVHTTDWESPDVGLFYAPDFLQVKSTSDSFTYSCSYVNMTNQTVLVGETAATNEMCMAIGYYFPAGAASCN